MARLRKIFNGKEQANRTQRYNDSLRHVHNLRAGIQVYSTLNFIGLM